MATILTPWTPIDTDVVFLDPITGETRHYLPWNQYNDDEAAIDLANDLAEGEVVTNLITHLVQLASTDESADTDADDLLVGGPVTIGTIVTQQMTNLVYQRVYRMSIGFGLPGNHRNVTAVIWVVS